MGPRMEERDVTWILAVDDQRARLIRGRAQGAGRFKRVRLDLVAEIENDWRALQKPTGAGQHSARAGEQLLRLTEFRQRFASEVGRWFRELSVVHGIQAIQLLAPPRLTVMLRREYLPDLAPHVCEHRIDVGNLGLERLESRPEVSALLQRSAG